MTDPFDNSSSVEAEEEFQDPLFEIEEDLPVFNEVVNLVPVPPEVGDRVKIRHRNGEEGFVIWTRQYETMRKLKSIQVV